MFTKVLVANRGEIAVRIIRALREMGIQSVAIYSHADAEAYHTHLADEAVCVGPGKPLDSYNNMVNVISAALLTGCQAIHPGYGFLSEKAEFVELCEEVGLSFIGPSSQVIHLMGHKQNARETMAKAGVPIVPGSEGIVSTYQEATEVAERIGFPLMIKAADGGGGKGMRKVFDAGLLEDAFRQVQAEAQSLYGNQDIYIEKVIEHASHIEVQLLADHYGNVIHLGERDCSLQRKHQKVIEMAPASYIPKDIRHKMHQVSVKAAKEIGYYNAGTIEYLVDSSGKFYFMEMNTRLQVEHPITEMITGVDIVKEQIQIAAGLPLSLSQEQVQFSGFAIECRLNAENPLQNFSPNAGHIDQLILPAGGLGVRVESGIYTHCQISPYYDSMIAKIISHDKDEKKAFDIMQRALFEVVVEGVLTNIDLLEDLIHHPNILNHQYDTQWIEREFISGWVKEQSKDN